MPYDDRLMPPPGPNVVLIMADQLRWDALGAYGNPHVRTPHLDRIAREGARFERCYTSSPICMPARASVLTGRWPHAHGLWDNGVRFPHGTTTVAAVMAQHGYATAIVGKGHLDVHHLPESPDYYLGAWDTPEAIAAGGKDGWHGPYYGFQEARLTCGHNRPMGHYGTWLAKEHPGAIPLMTRERAIEPMGPMAWKSALPVELHASTWIADNSIDVIERATKEGTPFFLWTSFPDPHPPLCPPKTYADRYDPASLPPPLRRSGELAGKPPHFTGAADPAEPGWRPYGRGHLAHEPRDLEADAQAKAAYYAMIELIDDNVGRILATLEKSGQLDNTAIAVIADHGEMLGDHWLDGKGPWHYDGCTRVPLLLRFPRTIPAGAVVDGPSSYVSQCDVAPTLCELAGVPYTTWPPADESYASGRLAEFGVLPDVQGISLVPVAQGTAQARPGALVETEWRWVPGLHLKTLRTADYRLTVYAGRPYGELYDLRDDPHEFANRWSDPALRTVRLELTEQLLQQVLQTESRLPARLVEN